MWPRVVYEGSLRRWLPKEYEGIPPSFGPPCFFCLIKTGSAERLIIKGKNGVAHESCLKSRIKSKILDPLQEIFPHFPVPSQVPVPTDNFRNLQRFLEGLVFKIPFGSRDKFQSVLENIFFEMEQIYFFFGEDIVVSKTSLTSLEQMVIGGR